MRLYNGCPDSALQAKWDHDAKVRKALKAAGYTATWFPNGEFYMGFNNRHLEVTGKHNSLDGVAYALEITVKNTSTTADA